jgi:hypothetical protein
LTAGVDLPEIELRSLYVDEQLSSREVARLRGCSKTAVLSALRRHGIDRRPPRLEPIYARQSFAGDPLEKAYLIGFRDGDLHVHKANHLESSRTIVIACASARPEQLELIHSLFEPYGRGNVSTTPRQSVITCWVDLSFSFLLSKSERVSTWITADRACFGAYLAGVRRC